MSPARRQILIGYALSALGAALFSTKAIFIKLAYMERTDAALMLALRMAMSLPFFIAAGLWAVRQRQRAGLPLPDGETLLKAAATGFIGYYISSILDFEGLTYISAQLERLVLFTYPVFIMILGAAFFGGRLTGSGLIAGAITYAGLGVVFRSGFIADGQNVLIGTGLVLGCALTFALYQLLAKIYINLMGSTLFTAIALTSSGLAALVHYAVVSGGFDLSASPRFLMLAAGTAIFATVLPSFFINAGMARIGPQSTAMISTISPLITIYLAVVLLGETFTFADFIGSLLVIGGIGYYSLGDMRQRARRS